VDAMLCASPASLNVKDWFEPLPNVKFIDCRPYRLFGYSTDSELIRQIKIFSPDVVFVPTERYFHFSGVPVVNMLQNMGPFVTNMYGSRFHEQIKNWIHVIDSKRSIKKSDHIIAVSKFVRDFLEYNCKIPKDKIGLIYYGIDLPVPKDSNCPAVIPKGWDGQFLFTAGSVGQQRGLEDILYALNHLADKSLNISGLVIAGETAPHMKKYKERLESLIKLKNLSSKICWTGNLNEKEMAWCYQNCRAFVMTSRVESFGMVAGEAMAYGCICIAADNPCLPEIFGDAAVYYPPKDYKALAETIQNVLSWDNNQRNEASERAKKHAAEFSWDVAARRTVSELAKAVKSFKLKKNRVLTWL
jgi:glycosyltransferase involved in cell wall biosynthesis